MGILPVLISSERPASDKAFKHFILLHSILLYGMSSSYSTKQLPPHDPTALP